MGLKTTRIIILSFLLLFSLPSLGKEVNPIDYGLLNAANGIERYTILLRCHKDAVKVGRISYKGIERIELEIPPNAQSIPLPEYSDFAGVELNVKNGVKTFPLFTLSNDLKPVNRVLGEEIDNGYYRSEKALASGTHLVVVTDQNQWIQNRKGYSYGVTRRDVFLVKNGTTRMKPISSYMTSSSDPKAEYCEVSSNKKVIKNLSFIRTDDSTEKTFLFKISNQYNLSIFNIKLTTPNKPGIIGDAAIQISNCVKVVLSDLTVNGTYSQKNQFGYGISIGNVSDLTVKRLFAKTEWGVFGNNYISNATLIDCDINRFDIHCYGRNVKAIRCHFNSGYNQFSSVYGEMVFDKCTFTDFVPFLFESSFNAYTPFDLLFKNCSFNFNAKRNYLINLFGVPEQYNEREELERKCLPNITVKNCRVNLSDDVTNWFLIRTDGVYYQDSFDYISRIWIRGITVNRGGKELFNISTEKLDMTNRIETEVDFN